MTNAFETGARRGDNPSSSPRLKRWISITTSALFVLIATPILAWAQTCQQLESEMQQAGKVYQACLNNTHGPCSTQKLTWLALVAAAHGKCNPPPPPHPPTPLHGTDISPNSSYGSPPGQADAGGRVWSLAIEPDNKTLYAATWLSGVWKSTDAGKSWRQSSLGMDNALNIFSNTSLAIDSTNSKRLLYATSSLDGREGNPDGGLWISTDGADTWQHAELSSKPGTTGGLCPGNRADISSVAFDSAQAFVAAPCGIFTNTDPKLADDKWTPLPALPFAPAGSIIAPNSSGNVLFVCSGTSVYRSSTLGQQSGGLPVWDPAMSLGSSNTCQGLSVAPLQDPAPKTVVAVVHSSPQGTQSLDDVTIVNFASSTSQSLGFSQQALSTGGSGVPAVFTARRPDGNGSSQPGVGYDVYAADSCGFWVFGVQSEPTNPPSPKWMQVMGPSNCNNGIHADSWSMAIPTTYDPARGICTAYASTDGGVFMNPSAKVASSARCSLTQGWVTAMSGLHTLRSYTMAGTSQPQSKCESVSSPCPALYLPSGDNDVWVSTQGGKKWGQLDTASPLGDAGEVHVDPAVPGQVVATRASNYDLLVSAHGGPPNSGNPGGQTSLITPPNVSFGSSPGNPNLTQVLSVPSDPPSTPLYFAVVSPKNTPDSVVKNQNRVPTGGNWTPVEAPGINFANGQIAQVRSSGGLQHTVLYLVTTKGQVFKGNLVNGQVNKWNSASGTSASTGLVNAEALFVDPYDPQVAYVSDLGNPNATPPVPSAIKSTADGGSSWRVESALTAIVSDGGEFQSYSCGATPVVNVPGSACYPSLSGMYFDGTNHQIRVASTYPGGVAFSRDGGKHWIALQVTNNKPQSKSLQNPIELPTSLFYDDQLNPETGQPSLYVAMRGRGMMRVDGPFPTLQSLQFRFCPVCVDANASTGADVSVVIPPLDQEIQLQKGGDGLYTGSIVYDGAALSDLAFHFTIDGKATNDFSHTLTDDEKKSGIALFTNQAQRNKP